MSEVDTQVVYEIDATDYASQAYTVMSKYTTKTRTYASMIDGLKTVNRRTLYCVMDCKELTKCAVLVGKAMGHHVHGDGPIYSAIVQMTSPANCRYPLFTGNGNFGNSQFSAAAYRYTLAYLSEFGRLVIGEELVPYADYIEGESGLQEPSALPMLLPYVLLIGGSGMGVGMPNPSIPPVDAMQLVDYYLELTSDKDDKDKNLVVPLVDQGDCIIWDTEENVRNVVKYGGSLYYEGIVERISDDTFEINYFTPNSNINRVLRKVQYYIDKGQIEYTNAVSEIDHYQFKLVSDKEISMEKLEKLLKRGLACKDTYKIITEIDGVAYICGVLNIINSNIEYTRKCTTRKFQSLANKSLFDYEVVKAIEWLKSSKYIKSITKMTKLELINVIVTEGNFEEDIAKSVMNKGISYLTSSHADEAEQLTAKHEEYLKIANNPDIYLHEQYVKIKEMITPRYDSIPHSVVTSDPESVRYIGKCRMYTDKESGKNMLELSNSIRGANVIRWKTSVVLLDRDGTIYKRPIHKRKPVNLSSDDLRLPTDFIDVTSDKKYVIVVEDYQYISVKAYDDITDGTSFTKVSDGLQLTSVWSVNTEIADIELSDGSVVTVDITKYIKTRKSVTSSISEIRKGLKIKRIMDHEG